MKITTSALALSAVLALAACGSSAGKVTAGAPPSVASTTTTKPESTTTMHVAASAPIVMTASSKLGSLLVDSKGMTLYTLSNAGKPVPCTGQCATFWPPLLLPAGTMTAMGAAGVSGLGTATVAGGLQVTVNGAPVYRFSIDKKAGDTNGEGISSFGGTWHVVKAGGSTTVATTPATNAPVTYPPVTAAPVTAPPTTAYNYGY